MACFSGLWRVPLDSPPKIERPLQRLHESSSRSNAPGVSRDPHQLTALLSKSVVPFTRWFVHPGCRAWKRRLAPHRPGVDEDRLAPLPAPLTVGLAVMGFLRSYSLRMTMPAKTNRQPVRSEMHAASINTTLAVPRLNRQLPPIGPLGRGEPKNGNP